jgi:1D-myo-inositol-tetrakisphosphate 5-kinase/inositol-polyphosphate multikinase
LENLTAPFLKPNILDIKLGTVLYDEAASPEKVARMIATAQRTTSLETGIRLTGFQVHSPLFDSSLMLILISSGPCIF